MTEVLLEVMVNVIIVCLGAYAIRNAMHVLLILSDLKNSLAKYSNKGSASYENHTKNLKRIKKERF